MSTIRSVIKSYFILSSHANKERSLSTVLNCIRIVPNKICDIQFGRVLVIKRQRELEVNWASPSGCSKHIFFQF
jgi:hypothetical protein